MKTLGLPKVLAQMYDDGAVRNIREWQDATTGDHVVRMDLHISDREVRCAQYGGDAGRFLDAIAAPIARVRGRAEAKLRYDSRPRPRIGAGTLGYARRKR
jgi:hypothetical protein